MSSAITAESPRQVRINSLSHFQARWRSASRLNRFLLVYYVLTVSAQVSLTTYFLSQYWRFPCDRPLHIYLIMHLFQMVVSVPLFCVQRLRRYRWTQEGFFVPVHPMPFLERASTLLDLYNMITFIFGNYLLFSSHTCRTTSPYIYYLSMAYLIIGYLMALIPLTMCMLIIFCLPCMLLMFRASGMEDRWERRRGVGDEILQRLSRVRFRNLSSNNNNPNLMTPSTTTTNIGEEKKTLSSLASEQPQQGEGGGSSLDETEQQRPHLPRIFSRMFFRQSSNETSPPLGNSKDQSMDEVQLEAADAVCSICLDHYVDGEILRKLPCNHLFHMGCVDEWLRISGNCPLCKQNVVEGQDGGEGDGAEERLGQNRV